MGNISINQFIKLDEAIEQYSLRKGDNSVDSYGDSSLNTRKLIYKGLDEAIKVDIFDRLRKKGVDAIDKDLANDIMNGFNAVDTSNDFNHHLIQAQNMIEERMKQENRPLLLDKDGLEIQSLSMAEKPVAHGLDLMSFDYLKDGLGLTGHSETFAMEDNLLEQGDSFDEAIDKYSREATDKYYYELVEWLRNDKDSLHYYNQAAKAGFYDNEDTKRDLKTRLQSAQREQIKDELYQNLDHIVAYKLVDHLQQTEPDYFVTKHRLTKQTIDRGVAQEIINVSKDVDIEKTLDEYIHKADDDDYYYDANYDDDLER